MERTKKQLERLLHRELEELEYLRADVKAKEFTVGKIRELIEKKGD